VPRFISRYANHVLVMKPARKVIDEVEGITIVPGRRIQFVDGVYETDRSEEVKFIRNHRDFGVLIFEEKPAPGEEPQEPVVYTCQHCGKEFESSQALLRHVRKEHADLIGGQTSG